MKSCEEYDYLPIYYSWDRHCGGDWWQFTSRSIALTDSMLLAYFSARLMWASKFFGRSFGATLFAKSMNDLYESLTGERGYAREIMGDATYDAAGYAIAGYGLFRPVPKIGYLGNPKRDFFTRDPNNYEYAFMQYSVIETAHTLLSTAITVKNERDKVDELLNIEAAWERHLLQVYQNND